MDGDESAFGDGESLPSAAGSLAALGAEAAADGAVFDPPRATMPPDEDGGPNARASHHGAAPAMAPEMAPYSTHGVAKQSHAQGREMAALASATSETHKPLQRIRPLLARGFVDRAFTPSTAPQHADYMPRASNNNKARVLGVVAPRQIIEDWSAVGFDPWSAGKRLRTTMLVRDIGTLEEPELGVSASSAAVDAPEDDPALAGLPPGILGPPKVSITKQLVMGADLRSKAATDARSKQQLIADQMFSYTRNGRYDELEALLAAKHTGAADIDVDARDETGNAMLHVAAQNGNKRILKLALRRGADINSRNNSGNTPLHYAYAYGFEELGSYLISKGADDTLQNLEGLTPYEGLSKADLDAL
jgi:hypothetical protein